MKLTAILFTLLLSPVTAKASILMTCEKNPTLKLTTSKVGVVNIAGGQFCIRVKVESLDRMILLDQIVSKKDGVCRLTSPHGFNISCQKDPQPQAQITELKFQIAGTFPVSEFQIRAKVSNSPDSLNLTQIVKMRNDWCFLTAKSIST